MKKILITLWILLCATILLAEDITETTIEFPLYKKENTATKNPDGTIAYGIRFLPTDQKTTCSFKGKIFLPSKELIPQKDKNLSTPIATAESHLYAIKESDFSSLNEIINYKNDDIIKKHIKTKLAKLKNNSKLEDTTKLLLCFYAKKDLAFLIYENSSFCPYVKKGDKWHPDTEFAPEISKYADVYNLIIFLLQQSKKIDAYKDIKIISSK